MKTLENLRNYLESQKEVIAVIYERNDKVVVGFAQDRVSHFFIEELLSKEEFEEIKRDWTFVEFWFKKEKAEDFLKFKNKVMK